jgi:hypothetical protein
VRYADDLVLLAKEQMVLQGMTNRLTEIGRSYRMEINMEETNVMRISKQPSLVQNMIHKKQLENVEYFNHLGTMITKHVKHNPGLP